MQKRAEVMKIRVGVLTRRNKFGYGKTENIGIIKLRGDIDSIWFMRWRGII